MKIILFYVLGLLMFSRMTAFSAAQITELPDKGYSITTANYSAACDATGMLTSIKVGGVEFLSPPLKAPGVISPPAILPTVYASEMNYWQFPISFTGPVTREGNSLLAQNKGWWVRYTFTDASIDLEAGGEPAGLGSKSVTVPQPYPFLVYPEACLTFLLSNTLDRFADPLAQGDLGWSTSSRPEPGDYLVTASNGAALVFENASWPYHVEHPGFDNPPHRMDAVAFSDRPNEPQAAGTSIKRKILVFPHPDLERSIEMKIISPNPDHIFSHAKEVVFPVEVTVHYGQSFKGFLRFEGNNYVWTQDKVTGEVPVDLTPDHPTQKINLVIRPAKPGHIVGKILATDGTTIFNGKRIGFVFNPEQIPPVVPPKDFDAFWDDTMKELDKIPLDLTLTEQKDKETALGKVYMVKYRSWGGRWAWAWLYEPKTTAKIDATVQCPAVSVYQPEQPVPADGAFRIEAAIHGGDLKDYPAKPDFDYMNDGLKSRDTVMLRYSYCCLARCYDIIKSRPLCNGNVHVTGGSQGGGLSFVLGGLRPVTDIAATNIALCRIDWTVLGYASWGPHAPAGANPADTAEIIRYYDPACFMHRIHAPLILFVGLFDFCGPVQGIFTGINDLPKDTVCKVVIDPYGGHFTSNFDGRRDASKVVPIPHWQGTDADNKLNR
jgi:cephalosporin-C deacetylase-like acetyl esterase